MEDAKGMVEEADVHEVEGSREDTMEEANEQTAEETKENAVEDGPQDAIEEHNAEMVEGDGQHAAEEVNERVVDEGNEEAVEEVGENVLEEADGYQIQETTVEKPTEHATEAAFSAEVTSAAVPITQERGTTTSRSPSPERSKSPSTAVHKIVNPDAAVNRAAAKEQVIPPLPVEVARQWPRRPVDGEETFRTVTMVGIPWRMDEAQIKQKMEEFGEVMDVRLVRYTDQAVRYKNWSTG